MIVLVGAIDGNAASVRPARRRKKETPLLCAARLPQAKETAHLCAAAGGFATSGPDFAHRCRVSVMYGSSITHR